MITSAPKSIIILFILVLLTGIVTTGCGKKKQAEWVNTASMPGHATDKYNTSYSNTKSGNSGVVYLGDPNTPNVNFGRKMSVLILEI